MPHNILLRNLSDEEIEREFGESYGLLHEYLKRKFAQLERSLSQIEHRLINAIKTEGRITIMATAQQIRDALTAEGAIVKQSASDIRDLVSKLKDPNISDADSDDILAQINAHADSLTAAHGAIATTLAGNPAPTTSAGTPIAAGPDAAAQKVSQTNSQVTASSSGTNDPNAAASAQAGSDTQAAASDSGDKPIDPTKQ